MQKSKLIYLLKTFSKEELKKFDEFVCSPYFNKNSNAGKMFKYITKYSQKYESEKLYKENVYLALFPGKAYNIKIMKNLMTALLHLAERFLEQYRYEKNELGRYNCLLEEMLIRGQYKIFSNKIKEAEKLNSVLKRDEYYFYHNLNLYSLKQSFGTRTASGPEKLKADAHAFDFLIGFFLIWYFKYSYNLINRKINYNFEADFNFIEKVIDYVKERDFENKKIVLLYYYMFIINIKWNEENYFFEFKKLTEECIDMVTRAEQFNLLTATQTYCLRMLGAGHTKYSSIYFEACKNMVIKKAYSGEYGDVIHQLTYKNIVKAGAHEKQFEWTLDFIENYREKLPPGFRDKVYYFSLAYCYFVKYEFEKSLEYLSLVKYENVYDKAEVNRLMMQIYYEMGWTEELLSLTDTYKHFLHNDKLISGEQKKAILNFVNFLVLFYKIKSGENTDYNPEQKRKELISARSFEKPWLMEKLEEITK